MKISATVARARAGVNPPKFFFVLAFSFFVTMACTQRAVAVFCGAQPASNDHRFDAVCGLQLRSVDADESWGPQGSGVYVQWTDPVTSTTKVGILTARHFISTGGSAGECVQTDLWYAYFRCWIPGNSSCYPLCVGAEEDMFRVRITCFTLASGEFAGSDTVVIGEIDSRDVQYLCNITPMTILNVVELGCVMGHEAYIAGWGKWTPPSCCDCSLQPEGKLRFGATEIYTVGCNAIGRNASIHIRSDYTGCSTCMSHGQDHDSGGALCVEIEGGALRLVGITQTLNTAFLAAAHQFITGSGTTLLCRPCIPLPVACADMNGDGREDCADKAILDLLGPRQVTPFCPGDSNGDGCAGTGADRVVCNPEDPEEVRPCFATCRGDVNRDGSVDITDYNLVADFLGEEEWLACPCQTCTDVRENCPCDTDYDGDVDLVDLANANGDYECSASAAGCGPNNPACQ